MPDLEGLDLGSSDDEAEKGTSRSDGCVAFKLIEVELRGKEP